MPVMNRHPSALRLGDALALSGFVVVCLAVAGAGGAVTAANVSTWYPTLVKPSFNPPNAVFGPVWTALYLLMAVAAWRVWRRRCNVATGRALSLWALQLALNLAWSFIFFGAHRIGYALIDITLLLIAILATAIAFWRIDRIASLLFVPYFAWVTFATVLNAALWRLNG